MAAQQSAPMKAQESDAFMNQVADYNLMFPYQGTYMYTVTTEEPPVDAFWSVTVTFARICNKNIVSHGNRDLH